MIPVRGISTQETESSRYQNDRRSGSAENKSENGSESKPKCENGQILEAAKAKMDESHQ
jgi:hypothetical protein